MTRLLIGLLALNVVALTTAIVVYRRARKAQKQRVVERPNSQYKSQYVADLESKDRYQTLDLARMHEINREETQKILAKLRTGTVRNLARSERDFLDRMVEAERRQRAADLRARAMATERGTPRPAEG